MHSDPDYSAAYVILRTDEGLEGHGLTFTIGRGNEVCALAIEAFRSHVVGQQLSDHHQRFRARSGERWQRTRSCAGSVPRKGVIHLALAAIVNAVWDLYAKVRTEAAVEAALGHDAARRSSRASTSATSPTH